MKSHDICPSWWADLGRFSHMSLLYILSLLTHLQPEMSKKNGQITPDSLIYP